MQMDYLYPDHVLQWLDTYGHIDFKAVTAGAQAGVGSCMFGR